MMQGIICGLQKKTYDIIVFDVFTGEITPSYLFTTEGANELKKLLNKDGLIIIQFNELIDPGKKSGYQSICNTLLAAGYKVYYHIDKDEVSGIVINASLTEIDFLSIDTNRLNPCCLGQPWLDEFLKKPLEKFEKLSPQGLILTDDRPMLDILNARTLKNWRQWAINSYALPQLQENQKIFK